MTNFEAIWSGPRASTGELQKCFWKPRTTIRSALLELGVRSLLSLFLGNPCGFGVRIWIHEISANIYMRVDVQNNNNFLFLQKYVPFVLFLDIRKFSGCFRSADPPHPIHAFQT